MDSDCLIKLAKAGIKEAICSKFRVGIPDLVRNETVERVPARPDAETIRNNIVKKRLHIVEHAPVHGCGEDAALAIFQKGGYDAIASDDRRFIRRLRALQVPYLTPAVLIVLLVRQGAVSKKAADAMLDELKPFISTDEYIVVKLKLEHP